MVAYVHIDQSIIPHFQEKRRGGGGPYGTAKKRGPERVNLNNIQDWQIIFLRIEEG